MVSGKRVLSIAAVVFTLGNAALWAASRNYVNASVSGLVGLAWLTWIFLEWNKPPSESPRNAARDQLIFGAVLALSLLALFVSSPSSPFASD